MSKRFGAVQALDRVSLAIQRGEFFSLLGPSGCGKTTLLRIVAGFETPDDGELLVSGKAMAGVPPQGRPVNTVFQNYALFPHLNVFDNVGFGLRMKKAASAEVQRRVESALELVHIGELRRRMPGQLSGGQKQRVALARALVNEPEVLLLDEPLSAIDAKLRAELQAELKNLQRKLGTTFVYVTHDQAEALALSDRIAVLRAGQVEQVGTPIEVYEQPRNRFVATFVGACNVFDGPVNRDATGALIARTALGPLQVLTRSGAAATGAVVGIRREKVQLSRPGTGAVNTFRGRVEDASFNGSNTDYLLAINGVAVRATAPSGSSPVNGGDEVDVRFPPDALMLLEP